MAPFDPRALVGLVLEGRYRVERIVGDGGHGVVLRAQHLSLGTPVALKVLRVASSLAPPLRAKMLARLRDEGRVLHALSRSTPAVVQALDVFSVELADGAWAPCLVMEWLEGVTLTEARQRGLLRALLLGEPAASDDRLTPSEVVRGLAPLAEALSHAHAAGIVHRDVKPSNVMLVGRQPLLKLLDFGIAKVMRTSVDDARAFDATGTTLVAFSPAYAAPEQIEPGYGATGPWTDVFALALVVVELLTGRRALGDANATECARRALDPETRPTPRALGVRVPDAIEAVLRRALAVDPRNRPRTADAFWTELADGCRPPSATPSLATAPSAKAETKATRSLESRDGRGVRPLLYALIAFGIGVLAMLGAVVTKDERSSHPLALAVPSGASSASASISRAMTPTSTAAKREPKCPSGMREAGRHTCLDELEVTVTAYDGSTDASVTRLGPRTKKAGDRGPCTTAGDAPANCVSLDQARAFCRAHGRRLPTREEWSAAASQWKATPVPVAAAQRPRDALASSAADCTSAHVCGLASGVSEHVEDVAVPCLMGSAWDSGFSRRWLSECRPVGWRSASDAGSSSGFRCALRIQ